MPHVTAVIAHVTPQLVLIREETFASIRVYIHASQPSRLQAPVLEQTTMHRRNGDH
jgi:hypothetical protein